MATVDKTRFVAHNVFQRLITPDGRAGTIVRAVYEGTGKGTEAYFTMNPGGTSKKYLKADDADNWVKMEEADVLAAMAAHETKMDNLKSSSPAK